MNIRLFDRIIGVLNGQLSPVLTLQHNWQPLQK